MLDTLHTMFYKAILFDLDDTIYDYGHAHTIALNSVFQRILDTYNIGMEQLRREYERADQISKVELGNNASSHNKTIYLKRMFDSLGFSLELIPELHALYWSGFYANMRLHDGVYDFIRWNVDMGIKVGILTDYETEYQVDKLAHMDLLKYIHVILTSEEVGKEKPSMQMFHAARYRMNANPWETIMIGDNWKKDIDVDNQMYSYWFQSSNPVSLDVRKKTTIFNSFVSLHEYFIRCKRDLEEFSRLSMYCGERFDLVQAGGGNTSVKIGEWMCIKASGYSMASITPSDGYVTINTGELLDDLYKNQIKDVVCYNTFRTKTRGSIETFMHAFLKKYTVHIHPIQVNRVLISKESRDRVTSMFPNSLVIDYFTPGIKVCEEIRKLYQGENILFLINHGIIITHDHIDEIYTLIESVVSKFEFTQEEREIFQKYKYTNTISKTIQSVFHPPILSYLSEDRVLYRYLQDTPPLFVEPCTFPDALIYCGIGVLRTTQEHLQRDIQNIWDQGGEHPKVILFTDTQHIYCVGNSLKKCREIEDVFKSNLLILDTPYTKSYLSENEIGYLNNWDAEKYRKMI